MRTFRTEAIVIKRVNVGEADRILTVFTREYGKLAVKATGVRRVPSRRSSHVELLNHAMLTVYRGKGMPVLTEAQTIENFSLLKNNLTTIGYIYHLCELIDRLCPENQELQRVFSLLLQTLFALQAKSDEYSRFSESGITIADGNSTQTKMLSSVHLFEIELLSLLGYLNKSHAFTQAFNTEDFIEQIIERKLKSKSIFTKMQ